MPTFGPGTLQIGEIGSAIDVSCHINSATIAMSKDEGDSTTKLCGTVRPGTITYTYALSGNIDVDSGDPEGFFAMTQAAPGSQQPFTFTPDSASGTAAAGTLIIDPLDFGGEEFGADMTSDFEFSIVGPPSYTYPDMLREPARFTPLVINGKGAKAQPIVQPAPKRTKTPAAATSAA